MEQRTTNATTGCRVAASSSCWSAGGLLGTGSRDTANVETKIALTPIGPTNPRETPMSVPVPVWKSAPALPSGRKALTKRTKMPTHQRRPPVMDVRHPAVDRQQDRDAPEREDREEDEDEPPGSEAELGRVELREGQPGANVDEARAVEHQVDHRREDLVLRLQLEVAVPGDRGA